MKIELELTKNLKLMSIEDNNWNGRKLLAVQCNFKFFGEDGVAFVSINKLKNNHPSYAETEITSELCDSFNELLEDNWLKIVEAIKEFKKTWEFEQGYDG